MNAPEQPTIPKLDKEEFLKNASELFDAYHNSYILYIDAFETCKEYYERIKPFIPVETVYIPENILQGKPENDTGIKEENSIKNTYVPEIKNNRKKHTGKRTNDLEKRVVGIITKANRPLTTGEIRTQLIELYNDKRRSNSLSSRLIGYCGKIRNAIVKVDTPKGIVYCLTGWVENGKLKKENIKEQKMEKKENMPILELV